MSLRLAWTNPHPVKRPEPPKPFVVPDPAFKRDVHGTPPHVLHFEEVVCVTGLTPISTLGRLRLGQELPIGALQVIVHALTHEAIKLTKHERMLVAQALVRGGLPDKAFLLLRDEAEAFLARELVI